MVNKKGFMRIVEASIAILLVLAALAIISMRKNETNEEDISLRIYPILEEIGGNATLRKDIIANPVNAEAELDSFVKLRIGQNQFARGVKICEINSACALDEEIVNSEIYSVERIVSASLDIESFAPKRVKIFLWRS